MFSESVSTCYSSLGVKQSVPVLFTNSWEWFHFMKEKKKRLCRWRTWESPKRNCCSCWRREPVSLDFHFTGNAYWTDEHLEVSQNITIQWTQFPELDSEWDPTCFQLTWTASNVSTVPVKGLDTRCEVNVLSVMFLTVQFLTEEIKIACEHNRTM